MTLQEEYTIKRRQYLDREISHQDFYRWLGNAIGVKTLPGRILELLPGSTDEHLNDIPLKLWDVQDSYVRAMAGRAGLRVWSLSDTVCVLKCLAREVKPTLAQ